VAAERALTDPHRILEDLVEELLNRQRRLDLLDAGGDPETAVRSVFSWSYDALAPEVAAAFRLMGQHPGPNLDAPAAAALWETETSHASRLLQTLNRAHLVEQIHSDRYQMHDLLRVYAAELAYREDGDAYRDSVLQRLVDFYTTHTAAAMNIAFAFERHRRPEVAAPDHGQLAFTHAPAARAWLDLQQDNIIATVVHTAMHGWSTQAGRLSATVSRYLYMAARFAEAVTMYEHVLAAAQTHGHPHAEAAASLSLADFRFALGHIEPALEHEEHALAIFVELHDRESQGRALYRIGLVHDLLGHRAQARDALDAALDLAQQTGDRAGEARALHGLGVAHRRWQRYSESRDYLSRALFLCREVEDRSGECRALSNLGLVNAYLGDFDSALDHANDALTLAREIQDYVGEGRALDDLGLIHAQQGRHTQALLHHEQAITACRAAADGRFEPRALNGLAEALHANGRHYEALARHHDALALAQRNGDLYEQARAHQGLANAYDSTGRDNEAGPHRRLATEMRAKIGLTD
jgi:tetratricopeptide (TPR) repeat protein